MFMNRILTITAILTAALGLEGCVVNPVTGDRELGLVTEASELQLGEQNYFPMQQSQGGVYDVDPELTAYVNEVGQRLAAVSDRPLPYEFVVLNNGVPNAWALPGGKIAINRGLLTELQSEAELAAVLGHEIVHAAARHSAQQMERGMLLQGLVVASAIATSDTGYGDLAVGGASVGAQLINQAYGREAELESDKYGMRYMSAAGYDPQGAVSLQETFVRLSEGQQMDWITGLFASHPPSVLRVQENRRIAANLPQGGEIGADRYQAVLKKTRDAIPAYEAYEEGRKALAEKDTATAVARAETAIGLFPDEANFYALRGDARYMDEEYDMARTNYSSALRRRDDFFYYHLQRGLANRQLGNDDEAVTDLESSLRLLPTAPAHYALGTIAEERGDAERARVHYEAASGGSGDVANAARSSFVRLDIDENPDRYVSRRCDAGSNGNLIVSLRNDTTRALAEIGIVIQYTGNDGRQRAVERRYRRSLASGGIARLDTGLGPYVQGSRCPVSVTSVSLEQ